MDDCLEHSKIMKENLYILPNVLFGSFSNIKEQLED